MDHAKRCALALSGNSGSDSPDLSGTLSCVADALSHIVHTARYIEEMVRKDPNIGSISLAIYARTKTLTQCTPSSSLHTLWGPVLDSSAQIPRMAAKNSCDPKQLVIQSQESSFPEPARNILAASKSFPNTKFSIPPEIAAQCLSFFVDASGGTVHPSSMKERNLEMVNSRTVCFGVKAIFQAHKRNLTKMKRKTSGLRYQSLLPHFLRNSGATVELPKVVLSRGIEGRPFRVMGSENVKLDIEKSDRNSKTVNFSLLAILLNLKPPGISIPQELEKISQGGYGLKGCKAWSGCNKNECLDRPLSTNIFFVYDEEEHYKIGFGVVDPFTTFLSGKEVPKDSCVIRFHSVHEANASKIPLSVKAEISKSYPLIWPNAHVRRVKVMGDVENQVLGTAILVSLHLIPGLTIPFEGNSGSRNESFSHVSNAALLCSLFINDHCTVDIPYPYMGWYRQKSIHNLKKFHFHDGLIPENVVDLPRCIAFLWHREKIDYCDASPDSFSH